MKTIHTQDIHYIPVAIDTRVIFPTISTFRYLSVVKAGNTYNIRRVLNFQKDKLITILSGYDSIPMNKLTCSVLL